MDYEGPWVARVYQEGELLETIPLKQGLANNFCWGVDLQGNDVWVATSKGVSHGIAEPQKASASGD
jgi:hypothetical protein